MKKRKIEEDDEFDDLAEHGPQWVNKFKQRAKQHLSIAELEEILALKKKEAEEKSIKRKKVALARVVRDLSNAGFGFSHGNYCTTEECSACAFESFAEANSVRWKSGEDYDDDA